jgi:hypothetical protein
MAVLRSFSVVRASQDRYFHSPVETPENRSGGTPEVADITNICLMQMPHLGRVSALQCVVARVFGGGTLLETSDRRADKISMIVPAKAVGNIEFEKFRDGTILCRAYAATHSSRDM